MIYSLEEAKKLVKKNNYDIEELKLLVSQVDTRVAGATSSTTYLLYNGGAAGVEHTGAIAQELSKKGSAVALQDTDAQKFLRSEDLQRALRRAASASVLNGFDKFTTDAGLLAKIDLLYHEVYSGKDSGAPDANRIANTSFWYSFVTDPFLTFPENTQRNKNYVS